MSLDPERVVAWRFHGQGLVDPKPDLPALFEGLVALHHTDPATARISALVRLPHDPVADVHAALDRALVTDRTVVRVIAMRNTLFALATEELPWFDAATRQALERPTVRGIRRLMACSGLAGDDEEAALDAFRRLEGEVLDALEDGPLGTTELADRVPALAARFEPPPTDRHSRPFAVGGRLLNAMSILGGLIRGPTRGSWRSSQLAWAHRERWLGGPVASVPAAEGVRHVVRRYLAAFGPVTLDDVVWWTRYTKGRVRRALATLAPETVTVEGWPGERLLLPGVREAIATTPPLPADHAAWLPGLDPLPMGTKDRAHWLDPAHERDLFDRSGNVGPTVWLGGRLVGGWAHRADGAVAFEALVELDADQRAILARNAEDLARALGPDQVRFRFVAPIEKRNRG